VTERVALPETRKFVLSVSDSIGMERELYEWLTSRGFAVIRANSTAHALALLERFAPDVVITNLRRKEGGLNNDNAGIELAAAIRRKGLDVPIALYTMNITDVTKYQAKQAGVSLTTVVTAQLKNWLADQL
jgi:DNA-binding NtrC family response regulator